MAELETIYSYMREFSTQLGERILEEYPALQKLDDPVSQRLRSEGHLRKQAF